MSTPKRTCRNCKHWMCNSVKGGVYAEYAGMSPDECRRRAPVMGNNRGLHSAEWPRTRETDSCGEHRFATNTPNKGGPWDL